MATKTFMELPKKLLKCKIAGLSMTQLTWDSTENSDNQFTATEHNREALKYVTCETEYSVL